VLLDPTGSTTDFGRRVLASLLDLAPQSALVHAPNINSYRRLQPGSWAPSDTSWGYDNRMALVRVLGSGTSGRFEFRLPGADCNPYLSLATVLASTRADQNAQGESRDAATVETLLRDHELTAGGHAPAATPLPRDLGQALTQFSADKRLPALLGNDVCEHLAARAAAELTASRTVVTDWERLRLWGVC
jgi:glutamine synthetase